MFTSRLSKLKLSNFAFSSSDRISFFNLSKVLSGLYPLPKSPISSNSPSLYSSLISSTTCDDEADTGFKEIAEHPFEKSPESGDFDLEISSSDNAYKVFERISEYPFQKSPKFECSGLGINTSDNAHKVFDRITDHPFQKSPKFEDSGLDINPSDNAHKVFDRITDNPFPKSSPFSDSSLQASSSGDLISFDTNDNIDKQCKGATSVVDEASTYSDTDKLYEIINEPSNYPNLEKSLDEAGVQITTNLVVEILHKLRYEEKSAFRFFTWAAQQEFYSHEPQVYNEMIDILSSTKYKAKQFGIVCDLLDYMKRNEKKKSVPIEVLLTILRKYAEKHLTHLRKFAKKKRINLKKGPEIDALNLLLDALCKCCLVEQAENIFYKVQNKVVPNIHTYNIVFFGWCRVRNPTKAMVLLEDVIKMGFTPESFTYNTAIDTFCRVGMVNEAIELLEFMKNRGSAMSSPTAKTYSVLIVALAKNDRLDECFKFMENMISCGCLPDVSTYKDLIEGMCCAGKIEAAYKLLEVMGNKGYPPDVVTYNCFLKVLCDQKNGDEVMKLYKRMIELNCKPSVHTFNMMITMFFEMNDPDGAFDTWHEMEKRGCARDTITYCLMIDGLFKCDSAESACLLLENVVKYEMKLPYEKLNSFMLKLGEIGDLQAIHRLSEHARKFYNPVMARRFALSQKRRSMSLRGK